MTKQRGTVSTHEETKMLYSRQSVALAAMAVLLGVPAWAAAPPPKRVPAFPGAQGFGAYTPGGRGGRIIEVTNLNTSGPGSLDDACRAKGPRIVVFRVSGVIAGGVSVREPFITIAGQTAPGDGICIRNGYLHVGSHDVIVRHLRSRPGDGPFGASPSDRDCIAVTGSGDTVYNVIVDHCSASWGIDENISTWGGPRNVTFQWCITSESLLDSLHPKGPHGMGFILGSDSNTVSVHHCLFAHNNDRNPYINMKKSAARTILDIRNNVMYTSNHAPYSTGGGNMDVNYVGNFLKAGKGVESLHPAFWVFDYGQAPTFYVAGNIWPGMPKDDQWAAMWDFAHRSEKRAPAEMRRLEPAPAPAITTQSAEETYESVLRFAGCTRPVRDVVDARVVGEVRTGAGDVINSQEEVGGWPVYASAEPPADTDHDAMPDDWEARFGFDPKAPDDGPGDRDGDGYTNVEEYLNLTDPAKPDTGAPIAHPAVTVQAGNDAIRGAAAREITKEFLAAASAPNATKESEQALINRVRQSGKDVGDVLDLTFVKLPACTFQLGQAKVTLTQAFELGAYEVTETQWEAVMGTRPWSGKAAAKDDPSHPATYVSYIDCQEFVRRLNACGGREYRLPTYAEWIYAARAGTDSPYGFGDDKYELPKYAWCGFRDRSAAKTLRDAPQAVGRLAPNPWGFYDMAGNALEWVHDWTNSTYFTVDRTDPMGFKTGRYRRLCGGHFRWRAWQIMRYHTPAHLPHYRGFGVGLRLRRTAE